MADKDTLRYDSCWCLQVAEVIMSRAAVDRNDCCHLVPTKATISYRLHIGFMYGRNEFLIMNSERLTTLKFLLCLEHVHVLMNQTVPI